MQTVKRSTRKRPRCPRCYVSMRKGVALPPSWRDWLGHIVKWDGKELLPVWKCPECGHSVSLDHRPDL